MVSSSQQNNLEFELGMDQRQPHLVTSHSLLTIIPGVCLSANLVSDLPSSLLSWLLLFPIETAEISA